MSGEVVSLRDIFEFDVARSQGVDDYAPGRVPFVTSSELNNGVVAYVTPLDGDRLFEGPAVCISGLGHATLQVGLFLPKGNGGDSLTVGVPRQVMSVGELVAFTAAFNVLHKWRFSFGRKCSKTRLSMLTIPASLPDIAETWADEHLRATAMTNRVRQLASVSGKGQVADAIPTEDEDDLLPGADPVQ